MPKSPAKATTTAVKAEPYPAESPTKAAKAGGSKNGVAFTEADDRAIMNHVLSISDINLRYNWPELANGALKQYTPKQVSHEVVSLSTRIPSISAEVPNANSSKVVGTTSSRTPSSRLKS